MILVTLGTQDKPFTRLLDAIQKEIDNGNIKDKVIVQAGFTKYQSKDMEIFDLLDRDTFTELIKKCDLLITHGGVGSILNGLTNHKKVIVCPRLFKYQEHMNDHQTQIVERFLEEGYILAYQEHDNLGDILKKVDSFHPKEFQSNTDNFIKIIENFIDKNERASK